MFKGELRDFQKEAVEMMLDRESLLLATIMGSGKAQPVSEPVLTPRGWAKMGELNVGDEVIGAGGQSTRVTGVFPQGTQTVYRVLFSDGSSTRCTEEHLWEVATPQQRYHGYPSKVLTLREMMDAGLEDRHGNRKWFLPLVEPVAFPTQDLPLDPYLLGVLLGDGSFRHGRVHLSTADEEILQEVRARVPVGVTVEHLDNYDYACVHRGQRANALLDVIRDLGLDDTMSHTKFIPEQYMLGDVSQRTALLQGLLDTDGCVAGKSGVEFTVTSPMLARGAMELVRSLGGTPKVRVKRTTHKDAYRVTFTTWDGFVPFRLRRKAEALKPPTKYGPTRAFSGVLEDGVEECVCISVEDPRSLYVTQDYVLTHNTIITIAALEELFEDGLVRCGLVIVPASLKYQWKNRIEEFTDAARVMVVDGTPKKRQQQYQSAMRVGEYVIVNYAQVLNDWDTISAIEWDFVVCDEVQAIKNFKAKRTKLIKKLQPVYRFGLTGQPVENRPEEVYSVMQWIDPDLLGKFHIFDKTFVVRNRYGGVVRYRNLPLLHETLETSMFRRSYDDIADDLPTVSEELRTVALDSAGRKLYRVIRQDLLDAIDSAAQFATGFDIASYYSSHDTESPAAKAAKGRIMSRMVCLRMLCDHPGLLLASAAKRQASDLDGSAYAMELAERGLLGDKLKRAPKYKECVDIIHDLLEEDERNSVVLFSFFKPTLGWLKEEFGDLAVVYSGDMNAKQKEEARVRFNTDPSVRLFLSSDAGGVGVDLPSANFLINYDLPWSAGQLDQRNARIRRLSSTHSHVSVVNLIIEGSIEQRQYEMLKKKRAIAEAIVDGKGANEKGHIEMDLGTLKDFLLESHL